jgi:hypothetical protein
MLQGEALASEDMHRLWGPRTVIIGSDSLTSKADGKGNAPTAAVVKEVGKKERAERCSVQKRSAAAFLWPAWALCTRWHTATRLHGAADGAGALGDARGSGHPVFRMHSHVTYTCVHAALLAVGEAPVAPYQQSLHTWLKFLASRIK